MLASTSARGLQAQSAERPERKAAEKGPWRRQALAGVAGRDSMRGPEVQLGYSGARTSQAGHLQRTARQRRWQLLHVASLYVELLQLLWEEVPAPLNGGVRKCERPELCEARNLRWHLPQLRAAGAERRR